MISGIEMKVSLHPTGPSQMTLLLSGQTTTFRNLFPSFVFLIWVNVLEGRAENLSGRWNILKQDKLKQQCPLGTRAKSSQKA